ncbi:MAG: imidazole glycerol phosphate synthase subunit HisH [bacterium]
MISIIDYGAGNLFSVKKALEYLGAESEVTDTGNAILKSDGIILPGVGAFGWGMKLLREKQLDKPIYKAIEDGIPFLGVCLGLQLLFEESEESLGVEGLGVIKGKVRRFPKGLILPHMGWNQVSILKRHPLIKDIEDNSFFYFVHSYYGDPEGDLVYGYTEYGIRFPSIICKDNIFAVQFHPEKSSFKGLSIYRNFLDIMYGSNTSY